MSRLVPQASQRAQALLLLGVDLHPEHSHAHVEGTWEGTDAHKARIFPFQGPQLQWAFKGFEATLFM